MVAWKEEKGGVFIERVCGVWCVVVFARRYVCAHVGVYSVLQGWRDTEARLDSVLSISLSRVLASHRVDDACHYH